MKHIVILSGSPRKNGNTNLLCRQFQQGAEEAGHSVRFIPLAEKRIGFCRACDACMRNGGAASRRTTWKISSAPSSRPTSSYWRRPSIFTASAPR